GFERGYFAFLGDPFGGEVTTGNLSQTIRDAATDAPEANTSVLLLVGFAGLLMREWRALRSRRSILSKFIRRFDNTPSMVSSTMAPPQPCSISQFLPTEKYAKPAKRYHGDRSMANEAIPQADME